MFPTQMLKSFTQRKILRVLSEQNKSYTVAELSEMCQRSEASISRALKNSERYNFIEKRNISGSKSMAYSLSSESEYSQHIRNFFEVEKRRERGKGTVPVEVWNLLEDISSEFEREVDGLIEIFLFGSYAEGNYYAGSDIDLLIVCESQSKEPKELAREALSKINSDKEIQIIEISVGKNLAELDSREDIEGAIYERSPVGKVETLIPLLGEIRL